MTKIEDLTRRIGDLEDKISKMQKKRGLTFLASVPPHDVCRNIVVAWKLGSLNRNFDHVMQILSDFYGVTPMQNLHNPAKVPAKSIACYYKLENVAYYKNPTSDLETVLHEFFHHIHANGVVTLYANEDAEKCANEYAELIMNLGMIP